MYKDKTQKYNQGQVITTLSISIKKLSFQWIQRQRLKHDIKKNYASLSSLSIINVNDFKGVVNSKNTRDNVVSRMQQWPLDIPQ